MVEPSFPIKAVNAILFEGINCATAVNEKKFPYLFERGIRPSPERRLERSVFEEQRDRHIKQLEDQLTKLNIDLSGSEWLSQLKSISKEHQPIAYSYFYWKEKSNLAATKYMKGIFGDSITAVPYFTKDFQCEACAHEYRLKYSKTGFESKSPCPTCSHTPDSDCNCSSCSAHDRRICSNINNACKFIHGWIEDNHLLLQEIIPRDDVKLKAVEEILRLWPASFVKTTSNSWSNTALWSVYQDAPSLHTFDLSEREIKILSMFSREDDDLIPLKKIFWRFEERITAKLFSPKKNTLSVKANVTDRKPISNRSGSKIYVLTTSRSSKGYSDFVSICETACEFTPQFFDGRDDNGLFNCLSDLGAKRGDTVVIVRGGGDTNHDSFTAFKSPNASNAIKALTILGVRIIVGVGHAGDDFPIADHATLVAITPTDAAYKLLNIIGQNVIA